MQHTEAVEISGHLMDSGILSQVLDDIREYGGDYVIERFDVGHDAGDPSHAEIKVSAEDDEALQRLLMRLQTRGVNQTDPDSEAVDYAGSIGNPKWAGTAHIGYDWGSWYARWGVDYIKGTDDRFLTEDLGYDPAVYDFSMPDYWLHTATIRFEPSPAAAALGSSR